MIRVTLAVASLWFGLAAMAAEKAKNHLSGEVSLEQVVRFALAHNAEVQNAIHEIERTRGQYLEVRATALPHATATSSYRQEDKDLLERTSRDIGGLNSIGGSFNDFNRGGDKTWRIAVEIRQLLYSGGQVKSALRIADNTTDIGYLSLRETVDSVIAQTRKQFYAALLNRELIQVAEESIALLEEELKDQKNRFEAGTVPRFNVLRAEVELANAKPDLIRAKNNHLLALLDLAKSAGAPQPAGGRPSFTPRGQLRSASREWSLEAALSSARRNRAALKIQERSVLNETEQVNIAKATGKPRIEANAGYEVRNSRLTDDISKDVNGWYFGVQGTWNIFDAGETKGKVIQSQAKLGTARTKQRDTAQLVELEVHRAFARMREAKETIASQAKTVEQAEEALRLARERLAAGAGTQLDVLDARVALTRARTTELQARYEFSAAIAEFDRATGADTVFDDTFTEPARRQPNSKIWRGTALLRE